MSPPFGGLVLVPPDNLLEQFNANLPKVLPMIEEAKNAGVSRLGYLSYAVDQMAAILSPVFDVSIDVLKRRIRDDKLDQQFA